MLFIIYDLPRKNCNENNERKNKNRIYSTSIVLKLFSSNNFLQNIRINLDTLDIYSIMKLNKN